MGTARSFQANEARGQPGDERQHFLPHKALFEHALALDIHAVELKKVLGRVDTQCSNLLPGGPSYDWQCV
jgi:hypothetical protein